MIKMKSKSSRLHTTATTAAAAAAAVACSLLLPSARAFFLSPLIAPAAVKTATTTATTTMTKRRMMMRVAGIESTPNPLSFKFDLDEKMHGSAKGITYTSTTALSAPEPVQRVLELGGVESVYALGDWLCLNKVPFAKWDAIVPAAVEALGGAAESLDPMTLLMASGGEGGGSSWQRSEMDGIAIRLQVSNGIPIQVEACPPGGTPLRRKLSARFVDAMTEFVNSSGDEMAFFKGRQWMPRGVRYVEDDRTSAESAEEALTAAVAEVELAFHDSRLRGAVADAVSALKITTAGSSAGASGDGGGGGGSAAGEAAAAAAAAVREAAASAAAELQSSVKGEVVAAVDTLCDIAGDAPTVPSSGGNGDGETPAATAAAARDALDALIGFAGSGDGPVAARRAAVAFIGGAGDAVGAAGLEAVAAVFRGDKSPGVRRTAGDALSDLGDPGAVPIAVTGLRDKSKLVRWRAARVVGELASREQEAVYLDEAREGEAEFEVAFEMSDAARKVRSRVAAMAEAEAAVAAAGEGLGGEEEVAARKKAMAAAAAGAGAGVGPVWKQIQDRNAK